jgi:hypothetical protein
VLDEPHNQCFVRRGSGLISFTFIGTFASQLAGKSWKEIQKEAKLEKEQTEKPEDAVAFPSLFGETSTVTPQKGMLCTVQSLFLSIYF